MQERKMLNGTYIDNYRIYAGMNLSEDSEPKDRIYIVYNQKHWYFVFEDVKFYNAFVRIRREHFKKMGLLGKSVEIDFYDVSFSFS